MEMAYGWKMENMGLIVVHSYHSTKLPFFALSIRQKKNCAISVASGGASTSPSEFPPGARNCARGSPKGRQGFCFAPRCRDVPVTWFGGTMLKLLWKIRIYQPDFVNVGNQV